LLAAWFSAQADRPVASETPAAANVARNAGRRRREPIRRAYLTGTTLSRARVGGVGALLSGDPKSAINFAIRLLPVHGALKAGLSMVVGLLFK
jgi:hypothetical protein